MEVGNMENNTYFINSDDSIDVWPAQTYASIMHNLEISDDVHHSSANSTPVNPSLTTVAGFIANYELRRDSAHDPRQQDVDLRALDFVEEPNESLVCTICAAPFVKPMELGCDHIFCEDCTYEHLSCGLHSAALCPKCRQPVETLRPVPRLLNQLLDELQVYCPNRSAGCSSSFTRYTISDHVNRYCDYEELPCPKESCSGKIQRRWLNRGCLHTHVECELCADFVMEKDLQHHEDNVCPSAPVACDYCELKLRRGKMDKHLDNDCPMIVTKCPGHVVGCKAEDRRDAITEHIDTCPLATLSVHFIEMLDRQTSLIDENKRLRSQVDSLTTRLTELEDNHRKLQQSMKKEKRRASLAETSAASANRIEELHTRFDELAQDYNTRLDNATSEAARLHMEMVNQAQQTGQRFYTVNGTITSLRAQVNHLLNNSRPAGSAGGVGSSSGTNTNGGLAGSGASAGGGVSLDTSRREPPKL